MTLTRITNIIGKTLIILSLLLWATAAHAQYVKVLGTAEQSGKVITSGISSTTSASKTFPGATITIYSPGGSGIVASIFSTSAGTVKANPFSASLTDATIDFFIAPGSTFDVRISGVSGGVTITPFTRSGYTAPGMQGMSLAMCGGTADTSLLLALNTLGSTIEIPKGTTCASNSQTLSVALQVDNGGLLKPLNSQTLILTGPQIGGAWQRFTNALSGQGTISFIGNNSVALSPNWWGAKGDGSTDDSAAINASLVAIRDRGHGRVEFSSTGNYKINSTVTLQALAADITQPIILSGYGTTITVNTTGTPGLQIKNVTAGRSFDHWIVEGFSFVGTGTESDILSVLNTTTSFSNNWQIRDVVIQITTGHGIHIDSSGATPGYGAFQFQVSHCHVDVGSANTTKNGIYLDGLSGTISSAELNYNTISHGKHGIEDNAPASMHVTGGTILSSEQEGIFAVEQSGLIVGVHVEDTWKHSTAGTGGGQIYIEGWADVTGLEDVRAITSGARWGIDVYNYGGPLNIIGRRNTKMSGTTQYVRVRKALTTGSVNLIGIEPDEVDHSAVDDINNPAIYYVATPNGGPALQTSGGVIASNTGLTLPNIGKLRITPKTTDTYGAAMTIDVTISNHVIAAVNGTSATVTMTPSAAGSAGDWLYITTESDASGTVTATFAATFHSSGTQATTASHYSTIAFLSDGTRWVEQYRTTNLA